jgi:hypothetical protein
MTIEDFTKKYPSAISHKCEDGDWEIWLNFTQSSVKLGFGKNEDEAWEDARDREA